MALPPGLATVTVTAGPYTTAGGAPVRGRVRFLPETQARHEPTGAVVLAAAVVVDLDESGTATVVLPASDAPDLSPSPVAYWVHVETPGLTPPKPKRVLLHAAAPTVNVGALGEVTTTAPPAHTTVSSVAGFTGTVTAEQLGTVLGGGGGGGGGVTDHGALTGLGADGHPHYLNAARGDARYYPRSQVDSALAANATADRARANHTGTQPASTVTGLAAVATSGAYADLTGRPVIPDSADDVGAAPAAHSHPAADLSDSTVTGRAVVTAVDAAAARTAIGAGTSDLTIGTTAGTAKAGDYAPPAATTTATGLVQLAGDLGGTATAPTVPGLAGKANTAHSHPAADLSDSTATGRAVITAADAAAARTAIGAGTSNLLIGTTAGTAAEGTDPRLSDPRPPTAHTHGVADLTATGTRDATTYLRGDGTWATPAGGGGGGGTASPSQSLAPVVGEWFGLWTTNNNKFVMPTSGTGDCLRLVLPAGTYDAARVRIDSPAGSVGSTIRFLVWEDPDGSSPGPLIAQTAAVPSETANTVVQALFGTPFVVPAGGQAVWTTVVHQGAATTRPTLQKFDGAAGYDYAIRTSDAGDDWYSPFWGPRVTGIIGEAPTTTPTTAGRSIWNNTVPKVFLRRSA